MPRLVEHEESIGKGGTGMAKVVRISSSGDRKSTMVKGISAENARRLADHEAKSQLPGRSAQFRVVPDNTRLRDVR
jgi:hypothetical protein